MKPQMPVILVWKNRTTLNGYDPDRPMVTTLLAAVTYSKHAADLSLYDSTGNRWMCEGVTLTTGPLTWIHRLAVRILLNPTRQCIFTWGSPSPYDLKQLRKVIRREIDDDDDILTQFRSKTACHELVDQAATAEGLIKGVQKLNEGEPEPSPRPYGSPAAGSPSGQA